MTCEHVEVVPRLPFLDDELPLGVLPGVHAVHHVPQVLGLQLLQEVILHHRSVDKPFGTGDTNKQIQ